jgi:hypothetical protein
MTLHDARTFNVPRTAGTWPAQRLAEARAVSAPRPGSSPALSVYGGAQRGISLAEVDFVGESTSNPLWEIQP